MRLFPERTAYPRDRDLMRIVEAAASRLAGELERLDASSVRLSEPTRRIFEERRSRLGAYVRNCAHAFAWSLPQDERPFTDLSLVAYNDRLGVFSLLAKECSVGAVVHHDCDDDRLDDAKSIARAIGYPADYYIFGDADEVEFVLERDKLACDVFVSPVVHAAGGRLLPPGRLISLLDTLSRRTEGALSLGLALEGGPPEKSPLSDLYILAGALNNAGFETRVVRGRSTFSLESPGDGGRRPVVLSGSRTSGVHSTGVDSSPQEHRAAESDIRETVPAS